MYFFEKSIMADKNILIVDDSRDLGKLLKSAIATLGPDMVVQVVPSAEEALIESPRRHFDLALVDVRLPGITGFDLVTKLRTRQKDLKVIVMTGMMDDEYRQQAEKMKVDVFFTKPLDMSIFLDAVQRLLGLKADPVETENTPAKPEEEAHLPELIAGLRQECAAESMVLLDDNGRVVVRAGSVLDEELENIGGPIILSSLSAAKKVWNLVGHSTIRSGQIFTGNKKDLVVMPVGDFALLAVFPPGRSLLRLAAALESVTTLRDRLLAVLTQIGAPVQTPQPVLPPEALSALNENAQAAPQAPAEAEPAVEESGDLTAMAELFAQSREKLKKEDVDLDAFWETASEKTSTATVNPDALSYDQARQLGLAPAENHEPPSG